MANAKFFYSVSVVESEFVFSFDEESSVVFCDESLSSLFVVLSLDVFSSFLDEEDLNRVTYSVLNLNGPAGGWPEISLIGDEQILNKILDEFGHNNDQNYSYNKGYYL